MNKSFLKFATDFGPLAIFFYYYYNNDKNLAVAIPPLIVATLIALAVVWFLRGKATGLYDEYRSRNFSFELISLLKNILFQALSAVIILFIIKRPLLGIIYCATIESDI